MKSKVFIIWFFLRKRPNKNLKSYLYKRTNAENFIKKNFKRVAPEGQIYAKILNFDSFGAVVRHFCPDKRAKFHVYRANVSAGNNSKVVDRYMILMLKTSMEV